MGSILRYLLLTCLLLEIIYFSILERQFEIGWWVLLINGVNAPTFFCALCLSISTDLHDNDREKGFWRIYHDWLHILAAALVIVLAYLTVCHIQNMLTFPLLVFLFLLILAFDFKSR